MRPIDGEQLDKEIRRVYCTGCNDYRGVRCRACPTDDALDLLDDAPTLCVLTVDQVQDYLQARLDEWNALGDRKYEPANMWGYNFICACLDDLEAYIKEFKEGQS